MVNQCEMAGNYRLTEKCPHPIFYEGDLVIGSVVYNEQAQHDLLETFRHLRPKLWNHVVNHGK